MLNQLLAKNRELQRKLNDQSKPSSTTTEPPKPADPAPPTVPKTSEGDEEQSDAEDEEDDDDDEQSDEKDDEEGSSKVTPPPNTNRQDKATPPPPEAPTDPFAKANSTTHRAEWMAFGRRMESADAETKFPELAGLWSAGRDVPCLQSCIDTQCVYTYRRTHTHTHARTANTVDLRTR